MVEKLSAREIEEAMEFDRQVREDVRKDFSDYEAEENWWRYQQLLKEEEYKRREIEAMIQQELYAIMYGEDLYDGYDYDGLDYLE